MKSTHRTGNGRPASRPIPCPDCRKRGHVDRASARRHRKDLQRQGGQDLTIYRCKLSGLFHVGHRDPRFIHPDDEPGLDQAAG